MDPTANLLEQLAIAGHVRDCDAARADLCRQCIAGINRLAELVWALDEWVRHGGFLPEAWRASLPATAQCLRCKGQGKLFAGHKGRWVDAPCDRCNGRGKV